MRDDHDPLTPHALGSDQIARLAALARLDLSPDSIGAIQRDLSEILEYVQLLQGVDIEGVEPTIHPVALRAPLREDVARADRLVPHDQIVQNAPRTGDQGRFLVPKVVDRDR